MNFSCSTPSIQVFKVGKRTGRKGNPLGQVAIPICISAAVHIPENELLESKFSLVYIASVAGFSVGYLQMANMKSVLGSVRFGSLVCIFGFPEFPSPLHRFFWLDIATASAILSTFAQFL